jgi:cytochrome c oxidase subunit 2
MRWLILLIVALLGNIAMQVARLRGVEILAGVDLNKWNGRIMLGFLVLGMIGAIWSSYAYSDTYLLRNSASEHGSAIDKMFWITMAVTFSVFVLTNILLMVFAYKYSQDPNRKAKYYPENHKLEMIWTAVPAVVLTILVVFGIKTWNSVMSAPDENEDSITIGLHAYQFGWTIHYPGADGKLAESNVRLMSGDNLLGLDFTKADSRDDFISNDLVLPLGKRVILKISSQDVLHSAYLPHFRVKMDAVPGMPTRFHFLPTITTDSMRVIRQDTGFVYELACTEVCGKGHFSMRKVVDVVDQAEFNAWYGDTKNVPLYNAEIHGTELIEDPAAIKPSTGLTAENK